MVTHYQNRWLVLRATPEGFNFVSTDITSGSSNLTRIDVNGDGMIDLGLFNPAKQSQEMGIPGADRSSEAEAARSQNRHSLKRHLKLQTADGVRGLHAYVRLYGIHSTPQLQASEACSGGRTQAFHNAARRVVSMVRLLV